MLGAIFNESSKHRNVISNILVSYILYTIKKKQKKTDNLTKITDNIDKGEPDLVIKLSSCIQLFQNKLKLYQHQICNKHLISFSYKHYVYSMWKYQTFNYHCDLKKNFFCNSRHDTHDISDICILTSLKTQVNRHYYFTQIWHF